MVLHRSKGDSDGDEHQGNEQLNKCSQLYHMRERKIKQRERKKNVRKTFEEERKKKEKKTQGKEKSSEHKKGEREKNTENKYQEVKKTKKLGTLLDGPSLLVVRTVLFTVTA